MRETSIELINYHLTVARDLKPVASLSISIDGEVYSGTSAGDGQYDAFMKVLWNIYDSIGKSGLYCTDYIVTIPPGGKTDALVETILPGRLKDGSSKHADLMPIRLRLPYRQQ
ncbi:MAG: hypothetical protein MZV63_57250 [Marinilabiliales bacterium]|nr:hypothetical protein [Marinilabiliales bacterium]